MQRRIALLFCMISVALLSFAEQADAASPSIAPQGITVMADPSLTVPITRIARAYAAEYQTPISAQFAPTNLQIREVEEGAEANVIVTSKAIWIRQLEAKGLIDVYSRTPIARNSLVLTARHQAPEGFSLASRPRTAESFMLPGSSPDELSFALGDPEYTSEGTYALDALARLKLDGELEPYFTFFRDMRVLTHSLSLPGSYGLMFYTDATLYPELQIFERFSQDMHAPIVYDAVTVAGANMMGGRHFVDYLTSDKARAIFARYGFLPAL
jgi:molybdate transport system substrate-binding protein